MRTTTFKGTNEKYICCKCGKSSTYSAKGCLIDNGVEYTICKKCHAEFNKIFETKNYNAIMGALYKITKNKYN